MVRKLNQHHKKKLRRYQHYNNSSSPLPHELFANIMDRSSWAPSGDNRCDGFCPQQAPGHPGPNGATAAASTALGRRGAAHHAATAAGAVTAKTAGWGADSGTALDDAIGRFGSMTLGGPVVGSSSLVEHLHHQHAAADALQQQPHGLQHVGGVDGLDMGSLRVVDEVSGGDTASPKQKRVAPFLRTSVPVDAHHH